MTKTAPADHVVSWPRVTLAYLYGAALGSLFMLPLVWYLTTYQHDALVSLTAAVIRFFS